MKDLVTIGKITTNQGNKGEVRVFPLTDFPDRFDFLDQVYLANEDKVIEKNIESNRYHNGFIILKFVGVDDIGQALDLKDHLIKIPADDLVPLAENEYYIYQLIGFKVVTDTGEELGYLEEVRKTGGTDIFFVKSETDEYMIPASQEIVIEIDQKNEMIFVNPIPGLLDL